ncbi:MAG: RNA polymerase sigma factor [Calditrichaeota bacterium]|nr:RNA polymerase sigma factor [Calditrichota bacterium]
MLTEKQLIDRLKSGDTQSLKKIMDLHQDYVYTLVIQMVKLKDVAEELTQDVFIKVYNKINSYEERSKFTTWLYTITYRTCLNYLDKKKIVFNISELTTGTNETDISKNEELLNTKHPDILNHSFDREEKQNILWETIDHLPLHQGIIITLHYLQHFSIREISDLMKLPVNTIKTHLHRGRNTMREILLKKYSEEELI